MSPEDISDKDPHSFEQQIEVYKTKVDSLIKIIVDGFITCNPSENEYFLDLISLAFSLKLLFTSTLEEDSERFFNYFSTCISKEPKVFNNDIAEKLNLALLDIQQTYVFITQPPSFTEVEFAFVPLSITDIVVELFKIINSSQHANFEALPNNLIKYFRLLKSENEVYYSEINKILFYVLEIVDFIALKKDISNPKLLENMITYKNLILTFFIDFFCKKVNTPPTLSAN